MSAADPAWKLRGLLGAADLEQLAKAGWSLAPHGMRTADAYAVWGHGPDQVLKLLWIADPEEWPDAFPTVQSDPTAQLELGLQEAL